MLNKVETNYQQLKLGRRVMV